MERSKRDVAAVEDDLPQPMFPLPHERVKRSEEENEKWAPGYVVGTSPEVFTYHTHKSSFQYSIEIVCLIVLLSFLYKNYKRNICPLRFKMYK